MTTSDANVNLDTDMGGLEAMWLYLMAGGKVKDLSDSSEGTVVRMFLCKSCDVGWQAVKNKHTAYPRNCWVCGKFGKNTGLSTYYFR